MNNQSREKRKVLIADDDDDNRAMLAFLLEEEGWETQEAKNGKEAIEKIIKEQPDLLILDNMMPELTGVQVYQHIQSQGIKVVVILVTAHGYLDELASSLGIADFISKPYDIPDLLKTIESAYQKSHH
ncbi:response regulator [Nostoc sp. FACHB-152]|uniref:response regulator n=1 Tax=unclassified Nostoc TaxID=2593658 RepID=UPI0016848980|nr:MULTISPECIES: response regulator [unclassified Nostoc]MBD2446452.1 response regulator [Nostoc sp. FACHB-152]MBD2469593.1 response regulator [Nostoc sp. FACHB-145]